MIAPERVAVSSFGRRRSLSDLVVWWFPETFPENLPPQALLSPFSSLFLLFTLFLQFLHPSKPSLQLSRSGFFAFSTPPTSFFLLFTLPTLLQSSLALSDPLRTPSESLHRVPQKAQKQPFLGVPPKPPKRG